AGMRILLTSDRLLLHGAQVRGKAIAVPRNMRSECPSRGAEGCRKRSILLLLRGRRRGRRPASDLREVHFFSLVSRPRLSPPADRWAAADRPPDVPPGQGNSRTETLFRMDVNTLSSLEKSFEQGG